jgi:transposase-like protein
MRKKHSVEQIIRILGEMEKSGLKISDACRPHQITEQTYYRWKRKYGGMEVHWFVSRFVALSARHAAFDLIPRKTGS